MKLKKEVEKIISDNCKNRKAWEDCLICPFYILNSSRIQDGCRFLIKILGNNDYPNAYPFQSYWDLTDQKYLEWLIEYEKD